MAKLLCPECGYEFDDNLPACPECGCPANECKNVNQSNPVTTNQVSKVQNNPPIPVTSTGFKRDWAHYVYESGVIFWNTFTTKFADFDGRATRREYWSFALTTFFVCLTLPIAIIALIIPWFAVAARRLHDTNHSGWWQLIPWVFFFLSLKRSDEGVNEYGEPSIDIV